MPPPNSTSLDRISNRNHAAADLLALATKQKFASSPDTESPEAAQRILDNTNDDPIETLYSFSPAWPAVGLWEPAARGVGQLWADEEAAR